MARSDRWAELTAAARHGGQWLKVAQLLWVDDRTDGLHLPVGDVEHEDVDQMAARVEEPGSGLPVDLVWADRDPELAYLTCEAEQEAARPARAGGRAAPGRGRPPPAA